VKVEDLFCDRLVLGKVEGLRATAGIGKVQQFKNEAMFLSIVSSPA